MGYQKTKMPKLTAQNGEEGDKKWKSRPLYQTQPEVYGKVKWKATSERVNLFIYYYYYGVCSYEIKSIISSTKASVARNRWFSNIQ